MILILEALQIIFCYLCEMIALYLMYFFFLFNCTFCLCILIKIQMRCGQWECVHLFLSGLDENTWKSKCLPHTNSLSVSVCERDHVQRSVFLYLDLLLLSLSSCCWGRIQVETCAHTQGSVWLRFSLVHTPTHTQQHTHSLRSSLADSGLKASILLGNTLMVWSVSGVKMAGA